MTTTHCRFDAARGGLNTAEGRGSEALRLSTTRALALLLILALVAPTGAAAQVPPDVWRGFAEKVDPGTEINVRLRDGKRFRAVLVGTRPDSVLLQPKTRITVPVQSVPYDAIASLERRQQGGMSAAKAAAIGVGAGVATFFAIVLIVFAAYDD
jgi:hypothetical protein